MRSIGLAMVGVLCWFLAGDSALAQLPPAFGLVDVGFTDFRAYGYEKAFRTWSYGGPLERNAAFQKRVGERNDFWNSLGRCLAYKDVASKALSQDSTSFYVTAQFERGEVFFRFVVYQGQGHYSITAIRWATDPDDLDVPMPPRGAPSSK